MSPRFSVGNIVNMASGYRENFSNFIWAFAGLFHVSNFSYIFGGEARSVVVRSDWRSAMAVLVHHVFRSCGPSQVRRIYASFVPISARMGALMIYCRRCSVDKLAHKIRRNPLSSINGEYSVTTGCGIRPDQALWTIIVDMCVKPFEKFARICSAYLQGIVAPLPVVMGHTKTVGVNSFFTVWNAAERMRNFLFLESSGSWRTIFFPLFVVCLTPATAFRWAITVRYRTFFERG